MFFSTGVLGNVGANIQRDLLTNGVSLTPFSWLMVVAIVGILFGLSVFLVKYFIKQQDRHLVVIEDQIAGEADSRKIADLDLAHTLKEIIKSLTDFQLSQTEKAGAFVSRDELMKSVGKLDSKLDKFHSRIDEFRDEFVRKNECEIRHR